MSKHDKLILINKKNNRSASPGAAAIHDSAKNGKPIANPPLKLTRAQSFMDSLKAEIRKSVA